MSQAIHDKQKVLRRMHRVHGRILAIEQMLDDEVECGEVLQQITRCKRAVNGLLTSIMEERIHTLVDSGPLHQGQRGDAGEKLLGLVHSYFK